MLLLMIHLVQRRMCVLLVAVLIGWCQGRVRAQVQGLPADKAARVEALARAALEKEKIPGLSVAVVLGNELRYSAGFGLADVENSVPAQARTVYRLASVSKTITAVAAMLLAEQGRLDLDAPVQKYVPSFPANPWPVTPRLLAANISVLRH